MKAYLSASEFARLVNVNRSTVLRWIAKGIIQGAQRLQGTKAWRIPFSAYQHFISNNSSLS